jgi:glycyl-tRNA synthetase alpha subunit
MTEKYKLKDFKAWKEQLKEVEDVNVNNKKRKKLHLKQLKKQGWTDSDTWSLDITFAQFIIPRLKRYKTVYKKTCIPDKDKLKDIDIMIEGFSFVISCDHLYNKSACKKVEDALDAFKRSFFSLWW